MQYFTLSRVGVNGECFPRIFRYFKRFLHFTVDFVTKKLQKVVAISKKISQKWVILVKGWIVERTFAWLNHFRRTSKDYEISVKFAENIVTIAHTMILIQRI
jgi:putative transposase